MGDSKSIRGSWAFETGKGWRRAESHEGDGEGLKEARREGGRDEIDEKEDRVSTIDRPDSMALGVLVSEANPVP
jgi:hypothetical protein